MPQEDTALTGRVHLQLRGPDGALKDERHVTNLVLTAGKNWLATYLANATTSNMVYMAIGTGTTAVTAADTGLANEVSNPRVLGTLSYSNNLWQNSATYGANNPSSTNTTAITEGGVCNNTTSGNFYTHATWGAINKNPADTLTIVWQVTNS